MVLAPMSGSTLQAWRVELPKRGAALRSTTISRSSTKQVDDPIPFAFTTQTCVMRHRDAQRLCLLPIAWFALFFGGIANASIGDRLPEFRACVRVCRQKEENETILKGY